MGFDGRFEIRPKREEVFEGNFEESLERIQRSREGIYFAWEIGSTKIREDLATDLCTPKETQNPKQD